MPDGQSQSQLISLTNGYTPFAGSADEMIDASGAIRPAWRQLMAGLDDMGPDGVAARAASADQYLNDAGVYYRFYDKAGTHEREWPLAHIPLVIHESEWDRIADGLRQRADLLERIVSDIYGANALVEQGLLPPGLIASAPEYLRPLANVTPPSGHYLHFCAFELGRGPDGQWWVLSDRTQAPSGIGFALENRVATTKAFADLYRNMHVHRLAGFHRDFRDALIDLAGDDGIPAILTPGPFNETYYEHAYIARYLDLALLRGEDLTIADGKLMVRTVSGLQPVNVLWRRLDAGFADPLELDHRSQIGIAGLVEAIRNKSVQVVNALGSGILEMRALLAFMPHIAQELTGEDLKLPTIATWWCGQEKERQHVLDHLDHMMIGPALSGRLPLEDPENTVLGADLDDAHRAILVQRLAEEGRNYVGQESVNLSTTPVFLNGALQPRPVTLRVFLARTREGWSVMQGGFARVGSGHDTSAIAMQRGGKAADVWVVSDKPVNQVTLLSGADETFNRRLPGTLPAQAAEDLTWLGRYIERLEGTARMIRALHIRLAESDDPGTPLLFVTQNYLAGLGIDSAEPVPAMMQDCIDGAVGAAGNVRSRFSPDGWLALRDLSKTIGEFYGHVTPGDDTTRAMTVILRKLAGFSGLLHENMYRFTSWRFLEIGRRLERAIHLSNMLKVLATDDAPEGAFDMILEITDSAMSHRHQYQAKFSRLTVIDLITLDPANPRSLRFQIDHIAREIAALPQATRPQQTLQAKITRLHTDIIAMRPGDIDAEILGRLGKDIAQLYISLEKAYY